MKHLITTRAPGKIILSGEHAVVYGKPALALAVDHFASTTINASSDLGIRFEFLDKQQHTPRLTMQELRTLYLVIAKRYLKFTQGKCSIREVIQQPLELVQYAFVYLVDSLNLDIADGINIQLQLTLPIGCGMGASAAVILSLMHAVLGCVCSSVVTQDQYLYLGKEIENLQHGRSSGLDLFMSLYGGCYFFVAGQAHKRNIPKLPLTLVNTGKPESSTGECVEKVATYLQQSDLAEEFAETTKLLDKALEQNDFVMVKQYVQKNHELLCRIGVVPAPVQDFIQEVAVRGNAAKISGAGAIYGDKAGMVLVFGKEDITDIIAKYKYTILPSCGEVNGLCVV